MQVTRWIAVAVSAAALAAACGSGGGDGRGAGDGGSVEGGSAEPSPSTGPVGSTEPTRPAETVPPAEPTVVAVAQRRIIEDSGETLAAVTAIERFGSTWFMAAVNDDPDVNVVVSPTSLGIVLAMVEPGASGDGLEQVHAALGVSDPAALHEAMNTLEQMLESREPFDESETLTLRVANAAFMQDGYPFETSFLDTIGTHYGPVVQTVDFASDPEPPRRAINGWVSEQTEERIPELIPEGAITTDTRLALVNALYLNASWPRALDPDDTKPVDFTRLDGSRVEVPLMATRSEASYQGDGWVGADVDLSGGLRIEFVLPDDGRLHDVVQRLDEVWRDYRLDARPPAELRIPRFDTRVSTRRQGPPGGAAIGLDQLFESDSLLALAPDPTLKISEIIHEVFLAFDEQGVEGAAATAALYVAASGRPRGIPIPVILDRPFVFRIVDGWTGAALFLGQITDPTA